MDPQRAAWLRKYATERAPWAGPVHAAPLLADLQGAILEIGAGGGKVGAKLPRDTIALDWAALPPGRPGVLADARVLPFCDASFDAIVAIHVLGHVGGSYDLHRTLRECARVLRPGGALVVEVFATGDARDPPDHMATREGILTRYFDEGEFAAALDEAGFAGAFEREERAMRWGTRAVLRGRLRRDGSP